MGHIFDDLSYATPKHLYMGAPVDEIKSFNAQKSKDYNEAKDKKDQLDIAASNLDVRDNDYEGKKKYIDTLRQNFSDTVANGDWENTGNKVKEEVKKFSTDPFLNAAQDAYKAKQQHYKDLKENYDKGKLSEGAMNYALNKSQDDKIVVNPDGSTSGGYRASKILNDKEIEQQISDESEKFINDYKADTFTIGNDTYKKAGNDKAGNGQYFKNGKLETVGYDEVKKGLIQQLRNKHQDFLQQEKEIDLHNLKKGTNRNINSKDFESLGYQNEDEILNAHGLSDKQIAEISKVNPAQGEIAKNNQKTLKTNLANDEGRNQVFNQLYENKQLDKYANPYANKAAYKKEDVKWELDHDRQKNIDFQHQKALKDYDSILKTKEESGTIFGETALNPLTNENENVNTTNDEISKNIEQTKIDLSNATTDKQKNQIALKLQDLKNLQYTGYSKKVEVLKKIDTTNPEILNKYLTYGLYNKNNQDGILNEIINNPNKYDSQLGGFARTLLNKVKNNEKQKDTFKDMQQITNTDISTLRTLVNKQKNKNFLIQTALANTDKIDNNYNINVLGNNSFINKETLKNNLKELETKAIEKNQLKSDYSNTVFAETPTNKPYLDKLKDVVLNGNISLTNKDKINLDKAILDNMPKNADGSAIKDINWTKDNIDVRPEINWNGKDPSIQVTFKNGMDNNNGEGQKQRPSYHFSLSGEGGDAHNKTLTDIAKMYQKSSDPKVRQQGYMIESNVLYGKEVSVFNPETGGEHPQTTIYTKYGPLTLRGKLVNSNGADPVYKVYSVNDNGVESENPIPLINSNGVQYDHFKSAKDLADGLFNTYDKPKNK